MDSLKHSFSLEDDEKCAKINTKVNTFSDIFMKLLISSVPSCIGMFITENVSNVKFIFVGHLNNSNEIAAIGIAETMITLFYYIPVISNMTTMDTFVSASFGSKQYYQCGVYLNKTILILSLLSIPLICVQLFMKNILLSFGQDPIVADLVQEYFYYRSPVLVFYCYLEVVKRYLYNLGHFRFTMLASAFELIVEIILCYIFICFFEMDYIGTAIASGLTNIVVLIAILVYFKFTSYHDLPQECFHLFNRDSLRRWRVFLIYSFPAIVIALIECGIFDVIQICAGIFGVVELGANSIIGKLAIVAYVTYFATSITAASFIGKSLGEGNYLTSKQAVLCGFLLNLILITFEILVLLFSSQYVFSIFTINDEILETMDSLKYVLCIIIFISSFQCFLKCIFRVIGWQYKIVLINIISFCVIGNFSIYLLAFVFDLKLLGIWTGYAISLVVCIILYSFLFVHIDWKKECRNALNRINA